MKFFKTTWYVFIGIALFVNAVLATRCLFPKWRVKEESLALRAELQEQVATRKQDISVLKRKIDRFYSSRWFVEQLARANHRVAENEIVFIFDE